MDFGGQGCVVDFWAELYIKFMPELSMANLPIAGICIVWDIEQ